MRGVEGGVGRTEHEILCGVYCARTHPNCALGSVTPHEKIPDSYEFAVEVFEVIKVAELQVVITRRESNKKFRSPPLCSVYFWRQP